MRRWESGMTSELFNKGLPEELPWRGSKAYPRFKWSVFSLLVMIQDASTMWWCVCLCSKEDGVYTLCGEALADFAGYPSSPETHPRNTLLRYPRSLQIDCLVFLFLISKVDAIIDKPEDLTWKFKSLASFEKSEYVATLGVHMAAI